MEPRTRRQMIWASAAGVALTSLPAQAAEEKETGAVEDLMREHGVLRRALLIYRQTAIRLRGKGELDAAQIRKTAALFRRFGEDYHEKLLEEAHIFPAVQKAGGAPASYIGPLLAQHQRGRALTDYILAVSDAKGGPADRTGFADMLDGFVLMYENHAAREDTIVFQAWKHALSAHQLEEMGEEFEEIEKKEFGGDGFDDAVKEIGAIEKALGYADIAQFTAPPPPRF